MSKITATDAPVIMRESPYKTPLMLWEEKMGLHKVPVNFAMRHGTENEPRARAKAQEFLSTRFTPKVAQSIEFPWAMASLDGISDDGDIIIEIKCPLKDRMFQETKLGSIPRYYRAQVQHQLMVTGARYCCFCVFFCDQIECLEIQPNIEYFDKLIEEERAFLKCIEDLKPPYEF